MCKKKILQCKACNAQNTVINRCVDAQKKSDNKEGRWAQCTDLVSSSEVAQPLDKEDCPTCRERRDQKKRERERQKAERRQLKKDAKKKEDTGTGEPGSSVKDELEGGSKKGREGRKKGNKNKSRSRKDKCVLM